MGVTGAVEVEGRDPLGLPPYPRQYCGDRLSGARWNGEWIEPRDETPRRCFRCGWRGQLARLVWERQGRGRSSGMSVLLCFLCRYDERQRLHELRIYPTTEAPREAA